MSEILVPRPAATILTLRDSDGGFEVLMLRRNLNSDFVGGAYVFPGGSVGERDARSDLHARVLGLTDERASARLGVVSGGLAYFVAGLRELFEEAGLLIACDVHGRAVNLRDPERARRLARHRDELNAHAGDLLEILMEEELVLDLRNITYLAHWVTPVGSPRRFDTRFFVTYAPDDQIAAHDQGETVATRWVRPLDALEAHERGELEMVLPTIKNLENIAAFGSIGEVIAYANSLSEIARIEPRIVERDGTRVPVMPGEDGYDD